MNPFSFARRVTVLLLLCTSTSAFAEPAGALDPTFDSDGKQTIAFESLAQQGDAYTRDVAYAMELAPGGRIYLAGNVVRDQNNYSIGLTRLKYDGSLDTSFGDQGLIVHDIVTGYNLVYGSALQPDGKLLVTGAVLVNGAGSQLMVCRFDKNGARDSSFGDAQSSGCTLFPDVITTNYFAPD